MHRGKEKLGQFVITNCPKFRIKTELPAEACSTGRKSVNYNLMS